AGGFAMASVARTTKSDLMRQIDMNFVTAFLCCRASVNCMIHTRAGGRIVNVASRPALEWRTGAGMAAYTASKAEVAAMTVALAEEVVKEGILVNAIVPSTIDTSANRQAMPKADHTGWAKVEEVRRRSCSWHRQTTASRAAPWCRCMGRRRVCGPIRP